MDQKTSTDTQRKQYQEYINKYQQEFIDAMQENETKEKFFFDKWQRHDGNGSGLTVVLQDGNFFEKAGINTTQMEIPLSKQMASTILERGTTCLREDNVQDYRLYANGISLVIHPINPYVPTTHANFRYIEILHKDTREIAASWFGGGGDLTPHYLFEEDCKLFHQLQKDACDKYDKELYPKLKKKCDDYFYIKHRNEHRGIGGTFYDDFLIENDWNKTFEFVKDLSQSMLSSYKQIVARRKDIKYDESNVLWRKVRRGRYVEFNLVYDRGTKFGFNTPNARIESILMSLPLEVRWEYQFEVKEGSEEEKMQKVLQQAQEWV